MSSEMSKAYDAAAVQAEVAAVWEAENCFHAEPTATGEPYSIVIPPPNVTAALHLGHALNNTVQDVLIRKARMEGKNAVWLPGTDHAGIATQTVVEKRLIKDEGKRRVDYPRDEFVAKTQAFKDEFEQVILGQIRAMGCSADWARNAFTMDEPRSAAVREAFFQLFKSGLIYRGKRLVNWDPVTQTALADDEVEMEDVDGHFYFLKYPLADGSGHVTVATTRPETMLGDTAVAINPKDPRAAALKGKTLRLPIVGREIPIVEDDYVVMPVQYGGDPADPKAQHATGFLKVTPAHDTNDYEIGQRHGLPVINVMAPDASISNTHGWTDVGEASFTLGLSREAAREAIVEWFRRHGLLEAVKPYQHAVGHSYRSHVPIEPYLSDQWYVAMSDAFAGHSASDTIPGTEITDRNSRLWRKHNDGQPAGTGTNPALPKQSLAGQTLLALARHQRGSDTASPQEQDVTFFPERYAKTYESWNSNIRDWCISRQLWWGHRIPIWRFTNDAAVDTKSDDELTSLMEQIVRLQQDGRIALQHGPRKSEAAPVDLQHSFICVREADNKPAVQLLELLGFTQDEDVLDTWFSSALWPMSTLGWPNNKSPDLAKWNPTAVLTTAREIITLWVSRMVMFNQFFLGHVPFKDVFIHAMIQDGDGRKMSKTLGNGVDPLDIIASHGTDAMRFTLASMCTQTQDVRMPVEKDPTTRRNTSPKFDLGRNFANKVWNGARFVIGQLAALPPETDTPSANQTGKVLTLTDLWILSRLNRTIDEANEALAGYRFDQYAKACYDFFWRDFCDWYVEASKPQMKDPVRQASTARVLASVLDASLRLLHPMMPFVTERVWWQLNAVYPDRGVLGRISCPKSERCINAQWPRRGDFSEAAEHIFGKIQDIVVAIRTLRSDYKVDAKKTVAVSIRCAEEASYRILGLKASIDILAVCDIKEVGPDVVAGTNAQGVTAGGVEIYVDGLIDPAAEAQRVAKRKDELTKAVAALKGRLGNQGYLAKAPPHLVKQTQDQLAEAEAELAGLS